MPAVLKKQSEGGKERQERKAEGREESRTDSCRDTETFCPVFQ